MLKKTDYWNLPKLITTAQLITNNNEVISIYIDYEPSRICRIWIFVLLNFPGLLPFELPHLTTDHCLNFKSLG